MFDLLNEIIETCRPLTQNGNVATYIPELSKADKNDLGLSLCSVDGKIFSAGDYNKKFTMQSVSKILNLLCCLHDSPREKIFEKVSIEPTSDGFNSIVNLETKNQNKPLNPFINSGAIVCVTFIEGKTPEQRAERVRQFMRDITENQEIDFDESVYLSEKKTGARNRALAYYMKSTGIIQEDVEEVLDAYFKICSLHVTCEDLARLGAVLANDGVIPVINRRVFPRDDAKIVKSAMALCGIYDESGKFAVSVGFPGKSGVSGAILGAVPGKMGVAVYGPSLNDAGTSVAGMKCLEMLSKALDLGIY